MRNRWLALVLLGYAVLAGLAGCATMHTQAGGGDKPAATGGGY